MFHRLVLFGAAGDLAARLLLPALAWLESDGDLPEGMKVLGADLPDLTPEAFRDRATAALGQHAAAVDPTARAALVRRLDYRRTDVGDPVAVARAVAGGADAAGAGSGALVAYLALPAALFAPALTALADTGLPDGSVVVVEKPFGSDLASARELNRIIAERLPTVTVFRNDHFLHAQTVQNLLGLRLGNRVLEPVWNAEHVESVDIVWDEALALEGRASYYDRAGALRDMLQNHLLQVLCLVAMEPPASLGQRDLRDARFTVLRAIRTPTAADVRDGTLRARYTTGELDGRPVPSYVDEEGVDPERSSETLAEIALEVDNWRWTGVPFRLRSGKALSPASAEVRIRFREVPRPAFCGEGGGRDAIRVSLDPPAVQLTLNVNAEGELFGLTPVHLDAALPAPARPPYAGLVLDVLRGDPTLSVRGDEAEESWRIVQPVLDAWARDEVPLLEYPAGSTGPAPPRPARSTLPA